MYIFKQIINSLFLPGVLGHCVIMDQWIKLTVFIEYLLKIGCVLSAIQATLKNKFTLFEIAKFIILCARHLYKILKKSQCGHSRFVFRRIIYLYNAEVLHFILKLYLEQEKYVVRAKATFHRNYVFSNDLKQYTSIFQVNCYCHC